MLMRAGDEAVPTPAALSKLYTELAEPLSERFGLALGASEPWDERLWIKVKGGGMLFTEEELDAAAAAQRRLELMYSAHTWGRSSRSGRRRSRWCSTAVVVVTAARRATRSWIR